MKNKHKILLLALILIIVACFAVFASGIKISYIENYGTNFRRNVKSIADRFGWELPETVDNYLSKTPEPLTTEEKLEIIRQMEEEETQPEETPNIKIEQQPLMSAKTKIIALKNAYAAKYINFKGNLVCASDASLICYGEKGDELWRADTSISEPILKTAGRYILVAEKGGTKIYMFSGEEKIWEYTLENSVISADISSNGDVVAITDKSYSKGEINVINRKGNLVYQWTSGKYEVLDADISPSSRTLAVSLLNTESGADSKILFFDLKESESYGDITLEDSIAFDIEFSSDTLFAVCDDKTVSMSTKPTIIKTNEFEEKNLTKYFVEDDGYTMLVFDNSDVSQMSVIGARGIEKASFETQAFPDCLFVYEGQLLYNNGRRLVYTTLSGKKQREYNCTRDIYNLLILDSKNLVAVYNSSIEFINL